MLHTYRFIRDFPPLHRSPPRLHWKHHNVSNEMRECRGAERLHARKPGHSYCCRFGSADCKAVEGINRVRVVRSKHDKFRQFSLFTIAARVTPIDEFGHYSIAWAFSMLIVFAGTALLIDPLPAITSIRRPWVRRPLLAAAVRLSVVMGCVWQPFWRPAGGSLRHGLQHMPGCYFVSPLQARCSCSNPLPTALLPSAVGRA